jgi:hypothetical protein
MLPIRYCAFSLNWRLSQTLHRRGAELRKLSAESFVPLLWQTANNKVMESAGSLVLPFQRTIDCESSL